MRAPDAEPAGATGGVFTRGEHRGSELMSTSSAPLLPQTSPGRKRKDALMRGPADGAAPAWPWFRWS